MTEIRYKAPLENDNGTVANFSMPVETANEMYSNWESSDGLLYTSPEMTTDGVTLKFSNSSLRFERKDDEVFVTGNTVKRLCPFVPEGKVSCEDCAVLGMTLAERVAKNCARSNTAHAFEQAGVAPEARLMLLPTKSDVLVIGSELPGAIDATGNEVLFRTLPAAQAVVIPESAAKAMSLEKIGVGMNGADSTLGVMTFNGVNERVVVPFCSTRENMGDRSEDEQILRKAVIAYLDSKDLSATEKDTAIQDMEISITLGASATLRNFAHKIQVPSEADDASDKDKQKAASLRAKYGMDRVTSAMVLDDMYPGALSRGNIFPEFEAQLADYARQRGEDVESPITPDKCPGDGQTCHVDYRAETKYALERQLQELGVRDVVYNDTYAMDPADINNNLASSRGEQNGGVERSKTNRTLNAVAFSFNQ